MTIMEANAVAWLRSLGPDLAVLVIGSSGFGAVCGAAFVWFWLTEFVAWRRRCALRHGRAPLPLPTIQIAVRDRVSRAMARAARRLRRLR